MRIVVPVVQAKNNRGIDDLLDMLKEVFPFDITEAYIINTDNPGMVEVAKALAAKSGIKVDDLSLVGMEEIQDAQEKLKVKKERKNASTVLKDYPEPHVCLVCGSSYTSPRYGKACSYDCRLKYAEKRRNGE